MNPLATFHQVTKSYADPLTASPLVILEDLNWTLQENTFTAITGKSGSGKSTLFNLLSGLDLPSSGAIYSCGYALHTTSEEMLSLYRNREIGLIFQQYHLLGDFTAFENILMPALIAGKENRERALELLDQVGLLERTHHYPHQLSGGEQQRVALARAFINQPRLLLADEPTGNLDKNNAHLVQKLLMNLQRQRKTTLLAVTHDSTWAKKADEHYDLAEHQLVLQ